MNKDQQIRLRNYLRSFITDERAERIRTVLQQRTRHLTFILENIYQPHNASAVLRSCEISGIQDVHVIENNNSFKPSKNVAMGAAKWLNIHKYNQAENNTYSCIQQLREKGYRIVSTTPHTNDVLLEDLPVDTPLALLFGTELTGLSKTALDNSDEFVRIPMHGFTESYNISVSAALCAYQLSRKLHRLDINWQLSDDDYLEIETEWYRRTIRSSKMLEEEFLRKDNLKK